MVLADSLIKSCLVAQVFKKALSCCHVQKILQKCKKAVYNIKKRSHNSDSLTSL